MINKRIRLITNSANELDCYVDENHKGASPPTRLCHQDTLSFTCFFSLTIIIRTQQITVLYTPVCLLLLLNIFLSELNKSFSIYLCDNCNLDVCEGLAERLCKNGIISVRRDKKKKKKKDVLKRPSAFTKSASLARYLEEMVKSSPETLPTLLEEMNKLEGLRNIIIDLMKKDIQSDESDDEGQCGYILSINYYHVYSIIMHQLSASDDEGQYNVLVIAL